MTTPNPVIAEILRGKLVESTHRGSFVVSDGDGKQVLALGGVTRLVYPRSAIKAFQALPLLQSGAADHYGLTPEEIAVCCSSHDGEPEHVHVVRSVLAKAGNSETDLECGTHWPTGIDAARNLAAAAQSPGPIHNNCSGKHAGMLALARHKGFALKDYVKPEHPVQMEIAKTFGGYCDIDLKSVPVAIDGCSVPTWALPMGKVATGFARLASTPEGQRIIAAVRAHPELIASASRFDTKIMRAVPRLFIKWGAEGTMCGSIAHAGLGFMLHCDDGAYRGATLAAAAMLTQLDVWTAAEKQALEGFTLSPLKNWRKLEVGLERASF